MRGQEPITTGVVLASLASSVVFIANLLKDAVFFVVNNALGLLILLIAISSVRDVVFTGNNLISSIGVNTYYILAGLLNPITRNDIVNIPVLNFFVDNYVLLQFLTFVNIAKLFLFVDIVFFKFGGLVISWYSFCWSFIEPFVMPRGINLTSWLKKSPHTKEQV